MDTLLNLLAGPYGGHAFRPVRGSWTSCIYCFGSVSEFEVEKGLWPVRLGRDCPALVFQLTTKPTPIGE